MKIWDTFLFNDELDMLECRLRQLENSPIYRHVLVEATIDHRGNSKPLHYDNNRERFSAWSDRIEHVIVNLDWCADPWGRIAAQREGAKLGLNGINWGDTVLVADVDEIPSDFALSIGVDMGYAYVQNICVFAVDWLMPQPERTSVAFRWGSFTGSFEQARNNRYYWPAIYDAGWHISWLGGPEAIQRKTEEFCHEELYQQIRAMNASGLLYEQGRTWFGGGQAQPVDVNDYWPKWIAQRQCPANWFRPRVHREDS